MALKTRLRKIFSHCFNKSSPLADSPSQLQPLSVDQIRLKEDDDDEDYVEFDVHGRQLHNVFDKTAEHEANNLQTGLETNHDGRGDHQQNDLAASEFDVEPCTEIVSFVTENDRVSILAGSQIASLKLVEVMSQDVAIPCEKSKDLPLLSTTSQERSIGKLDSIQDIDDAAGSVGKFSSTKDRVS